MIAVLLANTSRNEPLTATKPPNTGPATCAPRMEMNWLGSAPLFSSVVDHSVSSGLVIAIVITTAAIARVATIRRGSRIAGASWATLFRPEKARKAAAYPITNPLSGRVGPEVRRLKLWTMPDGPRLMATAITTSSCAAAAMLAKKAVVRALSLMPYALRRPSTKSAATVTARVTEGGARPGATTARYRTPDRALRAAVR